MRMQYIICDAQVHKDEITKRKYNVNGNRMKSNSFNTECIQRFGLHCCRFVWSANTVCACVAQCAILLMLHKVSDCLWAFFCGFLYIFVARKVGRWMEWFLPAARPSIAFSATCEINRKTSFYACTYDYVKHAPFSTIERLNFFYVWLLWMLLRQLTWTKHLHNASALTHVSPIL